MSNPFEPPSEDAPSQNPYGPPGTPPYATPPPAYGQVPYGQVPYAQVPYGQVPYGVSPYGHPGAALRNGLGVAALVLGIIGAVTGATMIGFFIAFPTGVLAVIFGAIGRARSKRGEASNKTMATWGFWLGIVSLVLSVIGLLVVIHIVRDHNACVDRAVTPAQQAACN